MVFVFFVERIVTFYLTTCLILLEDVTLKQIVQQLIYVVLALFICNVAYIGECISEHDTAASTTNKTTRSSRDEPPAVKQSSACTIQGFRLNWYPVEYYAFWTERLVMLHVAFCTFFLSNFPPARMDRRLLQLPPLIVFPASNLLYLLASNPNLLKLPKLQGSKEEDKGAVGSKENEAEDKNGSKLAKCEEKCENMKEDIMRLKLEVSASTTRCEEYYKLLMHMIDQNKHAKCREELSAATALSREYSLLLHNLDSKNSLE